MRIIQKTFHNKLLISYKLLLKILKTRLYNKLPDEIKSITDLIKIQVKNILKTNNFFYIEKKIAVSGISKCLYVCTSMYKL